MTLSINPNPPRPGNGGTNGLRPVITSPTTGVYIVHLTRGHWASSGRWFPARLVSNCNGWVVRAEGNGRGWVCSCPDDECGHIDTVASVIAPSALAMLDADDDTEYRPANPYGNSRQPTPPPAAKPRRKRA